MERAWLQAGDVHPALHAHLQAYPDVAAMKLPWAISLFRRVPGTLFQLSKRRRLWALGPLGPARAPGQKGGSFGDVGLWALAGDPHPGRRDGHAVLAAEFAAGLVRLLRLCRLTAEVALEPAGRARVAWQTQPHPFTD